MDAEPRCADYQAAIRIVQELNLRVFIIARNMALGIEKGSRRIVVDFLKKNEKIKAIKAYRDLTQVGLKVAKDAVDEIERQLTGEQNR